ncbi:MAG TPA: hypothetical protein VFO38_03865 [Candidatus Saccharimonadales bacterium]|nr:hypothetical protein [Candidatus Saccharimonadales bacterium]
MTESTQTRPHHIAARFGDMLWMYTLVYPGVGAEAQDMLGPILKALNTEFAGGQTVYFIENHLLDGLKQLEVHFSGNSDDEKQLYYPRYRRLRTLFQPEYPYYAMSAVQVKPDKSCSLTWETIGSEDLREGVENNLIDDATRMDFISNIEEAGLGFRFHFDGGGDAYDAIVQMFARHKVFLPELTDDNKFDLF